MHLEQTLTGYFKKIIMIYPTKWNSYKYNLSKILKFQISEEFYLPLVQCKASRSHTKISQNNLRVFSFKNGTIFIFNGQNVIWLQKWVANFRNLFILKRQRNNIICNYVNIPSEEINNWLGTAFAFWQEERVVGNARLPSARWSVSFAALPEILGE